MLCQLLYDKCYSLILNLLNNILHSKKEIISEIKGINDIKQQTKIKIFNILLYLSNFNV